MNTKPKHLFAPRLDALIKFAQNNLKHEGQPQTKISEKLVRELKKLKIQGDDGFRSLFVDAERGNISDFGDYEEYRQEEIVDNYDDFLELYESEYPKPVKWYRLSFSEYMDVYYIAIDGNLTFQVSANDYQQDLHDENDELCNWLHQKVARAVEQLSENPDAYNANIERNVAFNKRYGRILRRDYWQINQDEKEYFTSGFANEDVLRFKTIAQSSDFETNPNKISRMNAGDFFNYCKICYDANGYFSKNQKHLEAKEMYLAQADGRDCGLRNIELDSDEEFLRWHQQESHCGGHPWEICRGGNSTHISLYVHREVNEWMLILAGSSWGRAVETIKMALALHENNIPFNLKDASKLYKMLTGKDFIGIVPEHVRPRYCHSSFPEEDKIIDFMNLYNEHEKEIISKAHWYPLERVDLGKMR